MKTENGSNVQQHPYNTSNAQKWTLECAHNFGEWTTIKETTCTADGEQVRKCSTCGEMETRVIPATGHQYVETIVEPTCTEDGYAEHVCSICGDSYKDNPTEATGHTYKSKVTKQPTCTENGTRTFTCACGDTETVVIPATGHKYIDTAVAPTTTSRGYTLHKCSVCGHSYKDNYTDKLEYIAPTISFKSGDRTIDLGNHI